MDLRFGVTGDAGALEKMELYTVTFQNFSPELIELDPRCLRDCIIDAAWQVRATALAAGEATVTAKVLNVGPTDDVPVQFSVKVAVGQ